MHLLHVEDERTDADLVKHALQRTMPDIRIETVATLAEARDQLKAADRFDVALIDLSLPDGSGLELLGEIRAQQLDIAVLMLTGSGDQRAAIAALQSGADDYVTKDISNYARLHNNLNAARQRFRERISYSAHVLHVLYAEHNSADIDLTSRHLARYAPHIKLTVVPDAVVALSMLPPDADHTCDFDVLLFDYRLPGTDALEAVRTIRNDRCLNVPIIIVSGQGSEQVAARAIQLGVDDYISKHRGYLFELAPTLEKSHRQAALLRERKRLEQTTRQLTHMLESSPVVLYTLRIDNKAACPTWVSSNITRLFGFTEDEVLSPSWWLENVHPDDREQALLALREVLQNGQVQHDYRFIDHYGEVHWISDHLQLTATSPDGRHELLGAWHDVTAQKKTQQIQQIRVGALDSLIEGNSLHDVLSQVAVQLEALNPEIRISILLKDEHQGHLYTAAAPSLPEYFNAAVDGLKTEVGFGSCGSSAALGRPVIVEDVHQHAYWTEYTDLATRVGVRACWSVPFKDKAGEVLGTIGIYHSRVRAPSEEELAMITEFAQIVGLAVQRANTEASLRRTAAVVSSTREGVVVTDLEPRIVSVNPAYTEITGYQESEVIGRNPAIVRSGRQDDAFYQTMWASLLTTGHWQGEIWNRRKNGEIYPQLLNISTVYDEQGNPKNYVGVMTDISQIKESEANLQRLAHYDPLTGLPNRLLIQSRLEHALSHARRTGLQVAVLFLDLDRFKNVNDSLGHPAGDHLLRELTGRLSNRLRGDDTFGRLGGDEFLIILDAQNRPEDAATIARDLIGLLEAPFTLPAGPEIYIGASIGISVFPQDANDAAELIQHADAAMYRAKEQGRNTFRFYTPALTVAANRWMEIESRMRRAIANDEFVLHYQPQVEIESGRLLGCEALVRWDDPHNGLVSPADFIPVAEETGLIVTLGERILDKACAQFRAWLDTGLAEICLSINLSGRQLQQPDIVTRIAEAIERYRLPAQRIKVEFTESTLMGDGEDTAALLNAIKALGVRLSIDDFGTGYSSLAYLKRFPIDELKIDRSFVRDIPSDANDAEIAATIIAMAHNLNLQVVAEGVETQEQAAFLSAHGCSVCQGYLFSPPLPAAAFQDYLKSAG